VCFETGVELNGVAWRCAPPFCSQSWALEEINSLLLTPNTPAINVALQGDRERLLITSIRCRGYIQLGSGGNVASRAEKGLDCPTDMDNSWGQLLDR